MTQIPQQNNAAEQDPAKLLTHIFREFTGVKTSASRIAIPDDKVYNCENIIPIGPQNAHVVKNISGGLVNYLSDLIYWSQSVNLNNTEYLVNFSSNGKVFFYNIAINSSSQVNVGSLLSGAGSRCFQWKNSVILFIDATGYYAYDGSTFQKITGPGVPSSGEDIAVFSGRVWITQGRLLINSGADDYTAPAFLVQNGAAFKSLTDSQIRTKVQRMTVSNNLLYLFHGTGVNVISNVTVPFGSVPPTPLYQNSNIQSLIGSDHPASIFPYDRFIMFASRYGVYQLYGISAPKVSEDIDGTWQYLDFSQSIAGGQVVVENILCSAFLIKRINDPVFGSNTILAMWFKKEEQDRWWFANYGPLTFIVSSFLNNVASLYGFKGNILYKLFSDSSSAPDTTISTKLWAMEDDLARKGVLRAGFLASFQIFGGSLKLFVDTQVQSIDTGITINIGSGNWINKFGVQGQWQNSFGVNAGWAAPGPFLESGQSIPLYDHYVGLTLTSSGYRYVLNLMAMDYKLADRWT